MMPLRPSSGDEFYIGYEGTMPRGIGRRVRTAVAVFGCAAAVVSAIVVFASTTLPPSRFEFGVETELTGVLRRMPYPVLETRARRVWLAGSGKSGAAAILAGVADGPVALRGSRIRRGRHEMLEVHAVAPAMPVTLQGEIVDSKCFLGVMNPADGAVHRDCARRCLSGGLPPMLRVRDGRDREELVLLVAEDGRPISGQIADAAGVPIEVTGRLARDGADYVLYVTKWQRQG